MVRDPFPGNKGIPILNPMYEHYVKLYPTPNDVPGLVSAEGDNNYLAVAMPKDERQSLSDESMSYCDALQKAGQLLAASPLVPRLKGSGPPSR